VGEQKGVGRSKRPKYAVDLFVNRICMARDFFCDARRNQAGKNAARNGVGGEGMIFPSSKFRWNFPGTNHLNFDAISVISSFWRLQASSMNETSKFLFLFEYLKKSHRF